jgi:hypothetical protein
MKKIIVIMLFLHCSITYKVVGQDYDLLFDAQDGYLGSKCASNIGAIGSSSNLGNFPNQTKFCINLIINQIKQYSPCFQK